MPKLKGQAVTPRNKVTWVTFKTKQTTQGHVTHLVHEASKSPTKNPGFTSSSPRKLADSELASPSTYDADIPYQPDFDISDFEPLPRLRCPTKVGQLH